MTTLEIILLAIIWIGYGVFNAIQFAETASNDEEQAVAWISSLMLSPLFFVVRCLVGAFKNLYL